MSGSRRPGRTLLVKHNEGNDDTSRVDLTFDGVQSTFDTQTNSTFVVFDTVDSASSAYNQMESSGNKVKYSYYKMHFKVNDFDLSQTTYDDVKTMVCEKLREVVDGINILYFRLYRKSGQLTGSGDFVIDLKDHQDELVQLRNIPLSDGSSLFINRFIFNRKPRLVSESN